MIRYLSVLFLIVSSAILARADALPDFSTWPVFNVKTYGAVGNGVADDTVAFAKALAGAQQAAKGVVYIPAGNYLLNAPQGSSIFGGSLMSLLSVPNSQVVIRGDGTANTRLIASRSGTVFAGDTAFKADLTLLNMGIECRAGFSANNSFGVVFAGTALRTKNVEFRNFTQAIRIPESLNPQVALLYVDNCSFISDHGRAGVGQNDATCQYPVTSILGGGSTTHIYRSYFNGLADPAFTSSISAPLRGGINPSQYTPIDGFIKTINQTKAVIIKYCTVKNGGIEHILIEGDRMPTPVAATIQQNVIVGPDPEFKAFNVTQAPPAGTIQTHSGFYCDGMSGIVARNIQGTISNNSIVNTVYGIDVNAGTTPQTGAILIQANTIEGCIGAGVYAYMIPNVAIKSNTIGFNRSFTALERGALNESATEKGILVDGCVNASIVGNDIHVQQSSWWTGESTLTADLAPGGMTLAVSPAIPQTSSLNVYLGEVKNGPIASDGSVSVAGQVQLNNALPASTVLKAGTVVKWTTASLNEHAAICVYNNCGATNLASNTLSGGIWAIIYLNGVSGCSVKSSYDTFSGYDYGVPYRYATVLQPVYLQ